MPPRSKVAVLGRKLSGVRSGAHLAHLELGGFLDSRGHEVRYAALKGESATRHGLEVSVGRRAVRQAAAWADVVLVRDEPEAGKVLKRTGDARVLFVVHSPAGAPAEIGVSLPRCALVVWVSGACRSHVERKHGRQKGVVIEGCPMDLDRYRTTPGDSVTLVNLSVRKGAHLFWELARRMPDVSFVGVRGWGEQVIPDEIPENVTVLDRQDDPRAIYARTRILLVPSAEPDTSHEWGEAWNRVSVEAAASGIPVIAHPAAGIRASIGHAASYIDRDAVDEWETEIRLQLEYPEFWDVQSALALGRAREVDALREAVLDQYEALL